MWVPITALPLHMKSGAKDALPSKVWYLKVPTITQSLTLTYAGHPYYSLPWVSKQKLKRIPGDGCDGSSTPRYLSCGETAKRVTGAVCCIDVTPMSRPLASVRASVCLSTLDMSVCIDVWEEGWRWWIPFL